MIGFKFKYSKYFFTYFQVSQGIEKIKDISKCKNELDLQV